MRRLCGFLTLSPPMTIATTLLALSFEGIFSWGWHGEAEGVHRGFPYASEITRRTAATKEHISSADELVARYSSSGSGG